MSMYKYLCCKKIEYIHRYQYARIRFELNSFASSKCFVCVLLAKRTFVRPPPPKGRRNAKSTAIYAVNTVPTPSWATERTSRDHGAPDSQNTTKAPNGRRNVKRNHISYSVAIVNTNTPRGRRNAGLGTTAPPVPLRQHHEGPQWPT